MQGYENYFDVMFLEREFMTSAKELGIEIVGKAAAKLVGATLKYAEGSADDVEALLIDTIGGQFELKIDVIVELCNIHMRNQGDPTAIYENYAQAVREDVRVNGDKYLPSVQAEIEAMLRFKQTKTSEHSFDTEEFGVMDAVDIMVDVLGILVKIAAVANPVGLGALALYDILQFGNAVSSAVIGFADLKTNTVRGSNSSDLVLGGHTNDILLGEGFADSMHGFGGDDDISAQGSVDGSSIYGGSGNDSISGSDGMDYIFGDLDFATGTMSKEAAENFRDFAAYVADEYDSDLYKRANEIVYGSDASTNDVIDGYRGTDVIFGNEGDDVIHGDFLSLGEGAKDYIFGGSGNDTIYGGDGADELYGGDGNDWVFDSGRESQTYGEKGDDHLFGYFIGSGYDPNVVNVLDMDKEDHLYGGAGNDEIFGGSGDDKPIRDWKPALNRFMLERD